jgi:hypothetical protein
VLEPWFPVDTNERTPLDRSVLTAVARAVTYAGGLPVSQSPEKRGGAGAEAHIHGVDIGPAVDDVV